jgi:hypothetical protein
MNVTNKSADIVDQIEVSQAFACKQPTTAGVAQGAAGGIAADVSAPKSVTLSVSPLGQKRLPGYVCPEKVRIHGNVQSGDAPLSGTAALFAGGSLQQQHAVELEANWSHNYDADYVLTWNAATQTEQTLIFTLKFANQHGHVVKTVEKTEGFACRKINTSGVGQGAPGGVSAGEPDPSPSQRAVGGQLALSQALVIQAPKGVVRGGRIRLSGAAANATYMLKFYRKDGGSYVRVQSAQLPKQMTGPNGSFPLKALSGGRDWRLEVCPAGGTQGGCKAADFRLPMVGGAGGAKVAPGEKPVVPMVIVPGALN